MQTNRRKTILLLSLLLTVLLCGCAALVGVLMYLNASENTSLIAARPSPDTDAVVPSAAVDAEGEPKESKEKLEDAGATVEEVSDYPLIKKPVRSGNTTIWDCIWFGNYWQEDTNGDGHVFSKDIEVIRKKRKKKWVFMDASENDLQLSKFSGEPGFFEADDKTGIKWRVLDIDDDGTALLLSDNLLDIVEYNWVKPGQKEKKEMPTTWETCTLRSFLNSYDESYNDRNKDFSTNGFLNNAFTQKEIAAIIISDVVNDDNPVFGTEGGNNTRDKAFCLSISEAITPEYGFQSNTFSEYNDEVGARCATLEDPSRTALTTGYIAEKNGYFGNDEAGTFQAWWLRSPGYKPSFAAHVRNTGNVGALSNGANNTGVCVRPAIRINLLESNDLWEYAGEVSSDRVG